MAEIAIPILALGVMYLIKQGNDEDEVEPYSREGFDNVSAPQQRRLVTGDTRTYLPTEPPVNFPVNSKKNLNKNVKHYPSPNAATDRYFKQEVYEDEIKKEKNTINNFQSLTGKEVGKADLIHNNMVPFFGSKVTQRTSGFNGNEGLLDKMQGAGSQQIQKKAQAPLFAPNKDMHWANGAPNMSDFMQSRMNPSRNISNEKPWEEIRVGPGLNKGYTNEGSNGFNAGMEARKEWMPKSVDDLRVATNPKVTFGLANHEGPAQGTFARGIEGKIEKNRPDTFYLNTPDRWFTTTGREKGQKVRSAQVMQPIKSNDGQEYYGMSNGNQTGGSLAGKAQQNFRKSRKPVLPAFDKYKGQAHNMAATTGNNVQDAYGREGFQNLPNARSTTRQADEFGVAGGLIRAITAPILDMLRPSRKENVVGNIRPVGNAGGKYGVQEGRVWNPADRTKTTIKEQTIENNYQAQPYQVHDGGYETTEYQPIENQRDTTNVNYVGNSSATGITTAPSSYNAAYNANLNPNKEIISVARTNTGTQPLLNDMQNIKISKIGSVCPNQMFPSFPKKTANMSTLGSLSNNNVRGKTQDCERNNPGLLTAFNNNPYSKSLHSVA